MSTYITPALLGQATVFEFLRRDSLEPNLERVSGLLRARRDAMVEALERDFRGVADWSRPQGGYFLWLDLLEAVDAAELLTRSEAAGVTFVAGSDFGGGPSSATDPASSSGADAAVRYESDCRPTCDALASTSSASEAV